jgi:hypothetical protein
MSNKATVELINFWPDGYIGHTDSMGVDVGKKFLINIMSSIGNTQGRPIRVYSHFYKRKRLARARKFLEKLMRIIERDSLRKRVRLHGHNVNKQNLMHDSINIWYTSENIRPPLSEEFDLFLSHDMDWYDGRNLYLPIWATRIGKDLSGSKAVQNMMFSQRKPSDSDRKGVCAVISNPEPIRMAFIKEAQKHFDVDVFGAFGMPIHDKDKVLREYKFNICFENDEFPGYVTEKPFEAWINGCIPVWRGIDGGSYLNEDAIINVTKDGFSRAIERIHSILNDDYEFKRITALPLLIKKYDYDNLQSRIVSTL